MNTPASLRFSPIRFASLRLADAAGVIRGSALLQGGCALNSEWFKIIPSKFGATQILD